MLDFTVSSDVSNGTLLLNLDGTYTYTPDVDFNGTDSFTYQVDDGNGGTDTATVTITVDAVNDAPVSSGDSYTINEDSSLNGDLGPNVADVDGDSVNFNLVSDVTNGTLALNSDGIFTYTPNASFNGTDSFTFQVDDGNGGTSQPATVDITILPVNSQPVFVGPSLINLVEDGGVEDFDWSTWFTDVDGDQLSLTVLSTANVWLEYSISNNGQLEVTTAPDANGLSQIVVQATDPSGSSVVATIDVDVMAVDDTVTAVSQQLQTLDTDPISGVLLSELTDVDGESLVVTVTQAPQNGQLTINPDGTFTFDPDDNFSGIAEFRFVVFDGMSESNEAVVQVDVQSNAFVVIDDGGSDNGSSEEQDESSEAEDKVVPSVTGADGDGEIFANSTRGSSAVSVNTEEIIALDPTLFAQSSDAQPTETEERVLLSLRDVASDVSRSIALNTAGPTFEEISRLEVISQPGLLWRELDQIRGNADQDISIDSLAVGSVGTISSGLIVGYVIFAIRSGLLLSSIVATMPAWNLLDPLAIVPVADRDDSDSGETLEDIVETQKDKIKASNNG